MSKQVSIDKEISQMSDEELLELVRKLRRSRLLTKPTSKKAKVQKKASRKAADKAKTIAQDLSKDELLKFLEEVENV